MEVAIEQEEQNNPSAGAQLRMKKTQHMAISKTFIEMMTEYNKIQTDFRYTLFENLPKCLIWIFQFLYFLPICVLLKVTW